MTAQSKGPCQLFRENVTQAIVAAGSWGIQDGFRGDLCVVRDLGISVLSAVPETVAVPVHLQHVDVVCQTVQ